MPKEALADLQQADLLRAQPDAIVLQNLARAKEVNGLYSQADRDYNVAISMTANEVNPFWLRSALVKFQLGDIQGGFDILKRVENRFPDAKSKLLAEEMRTSGPSEGVRGVLDQ
jgi:tetratricopeptide (TPR) repeat protein